MWLEVRLIGRKRAKNLERAGVLALEAAQKSSLRRRLRRRGRDWGSGGRHACPPVEGRDCTSALPRAEQPTCVENLPDVVCVVVDRDEHGAEIGLTCAVWNLVGQVACIVSREIGKGF